MNTERHTAPPVDPLLLRLQQLRGRPIDAMSGDQLSEFRRQAHQREFSRVQRQAMQKSLQQLMDEAGLPPLAHYSDDKLIRQHPTTTRTQVARYRRLATALATGDRQGILVLGGDQAHNLHLAAAMVSQAQCQRPGNWLILPAAVYLEKLGPQCTTVRHRPRKSSPTNEARLIRQVPLLVLLDVDDQPGGLKPAQHQLLARQLERRQQQGKKTIITSRWRSLGQWQQMIDPQLGKTWTQSGPEVIQLMPEQQLDIKLPA